VDIATQNLFFGTDSILKPKEKDAIDKAKDILHYFEKKDPAHFYTISDLTINLGKSKDEEDERKKEKKWTFGDITISQIGIPITTCITCRLTENYILHSDSDDFLTQTEFSLSDKFFNIFTSAFFMLSLRHKFWIFGCGQYGWLPALEWKLSLKGGKLEFDAWDLFRLALYLDLKSDLITNDKTYEHSQSLLAILNSNPLFCSEKNAAMVIYAIKRMENKIGRFGQSSQWKTVTDRIGDLFALKFGSQMKEIKKEADQQYKYHMDKSKEMKKVLKGIANDNLKCFWSNKYTRKAAFKQSKP